MFGTSLPKAEGAFATFPLRTFKAAESVDMFAKEADLAADLVDLFCFLGDS